MNAQLRAIFIFKIYGENKTKNMKLSWGKCSWEKDGEVDIQLYSGAAIKMSDKGNENMIKLHKLRSIFKYIIDDEDNTKTLNWVEKKFHGRSMNK